MRRHEIAALTLHAADRVRRKQPLEDSRIELKRDWIDPKDAAARIAAHANTSRGSPIVWLFGIDEKAHAIPGVEDREFSDWWAQVKREFDDGLAPELDNSPVAVPVEGVTVVAVAMDTARPPYVVKNTEGGRIGYWVPWREGNATRAARHADLLRLLVPMQVLPDVDVLWASVDTHDYVPDEEPRTPLTQWLVAVVFYAAVPGLASIVFPAHRVHATLHLGPDAGAVLGLDLRHMGQPHPGRAHPMMDVSQEQLVLRGAGSIRVEFETNTTAGAYEVPGPVRVAVELGSPGTDLPVAFDVALTPAPPLDERKDTYRWTFDRDQDA